MRRVVTGEQVAQIYNPDPFARPVFRAPVYQTPAGLILLAWLARFLIRLARLAFRHPAVTAALALLAFMWLNLGWIGVTAMTGWAVLVLVIWWHYWPVVLRPVGERPGPGQLAGLGLPAQVGRGDDHRRPGPVLPGPDHPARAREGHRHPVRRPGPGPARLRPVRGRLRQEGRQPGPRVSGACCAGSAPPGPGRWCWSSSAATPWPPSSPPSPSPTARTSRPCRSGGGRTACPGWSGCTAPMFCWPGPPARARRPCCGA